MTLTEIIEYCYDQSKWNLDKETREVNNEIAKLLEELQDYRSTKQ